jgi:hypothetical protein
MSKNLTALLEFALPKKLRAIGRSHVSVETARSQGREVRRRRRKEESGICFHGEKKGDRWIQ